MFTFANNEFFLQWYDINTKKVIMVITDNDNGWNYIINR